LNKLFLLSALLHCVQVFGAPFEWKNKTAEFKSKFGAQVARFNGEVFDVDPTGTQRTEAVIVYRRGALLYERYEREMSPQKRHVGWSVSKSVMSLLYGVALKQKKFNLEDSICRFVKPARDSLCQIKIKHVLEWSTGLDWLEEYEKATNPLYSSVLSMLYGEGRHDMARFVLGHRLAQVPGQAWRYSSGDSVLAGALLSKIFQTDNVQTIFREQLFAPIGVHDSFFETDRRGTIGGASYLQVTPYDLLRIGLFVLNNGKVADIEVLEPHWMQYLTTPSPAYIANRLQLMDRYIAGAHWWVNDHLRAQRPLKTLKDLPSDTFYAMGHWGQYLIVVPSWQVVAIRFGDNRDGKVKVDNFAESVATLLRGAEL
jgi:CubicO group peptidase (beta-lactamase class C family)